MHNIIINNYRIANNAIDAKASFKFISGFLLLMFRGKNPFLRNGSEQKKEKGFIRLQKNIFLETYLNIM